MYVGGHYRISVEGRQKAVLIMVEGTFLEDLRQVERGQQYWQVQKAWRLKQSGTAVFLT
jgi:hypothetical protein